MGTLRLILLLLFFSFSFHFHLSNELEEGIQNAEDQQMTLNVENNLLELERLIHSLAKRDVTDNPLSIDKREKRNKPNRRGRKQQKRRKKNRRRQNKARRKKKKKSGKIKQS